MTMAGLTAEELEKAKAYIQPPYDDGVVEDCVLGARAYMAGAGVSLPPPGTPRRSLYDQVCHKLALADYDSRNPVIIGAVPVENPVFDRQFLQLQLSEPEPVG